MALLDFQSALGRMVRAPAGADSLPALHLTPDERLDLTALADTAGFRFTVEVQRSWCTGRAAKAAWLTLSILPPPRRERLLAEWVNGGGGTASFVASETEAFLEFIAAHLADPSHELTVCRMEQATLRASEGARYFVAPDRRLLDSPDCVLRPGRHATLVMFHAEPDLLMASLGRPPLPPLSPRNIPVLFAPGVEGFCRLTTEEEVALYERLRAPANMAQLLREGHKRDTIEGLCSGGALEIDFH